MVTYEVALGGIVSAGLIVAGTVVWLFTQLGAARNELHEPLPRIRDEFETELRRLDKVIHSFKLRGRGQERHHR
jgi:hypothetical protein